MSPLSLLLNLLWIVFGGLWMAAGWIVAAVIMAITIIGLPWARAAFNIASYALLPFGRKAVSRAEHLGTHDIGTGPFGLLGNIVWLVLAGWWLALGHLEGAICVAGRSGNRAYSALMPAALMIGRHLSVSDLWSAATLPASVLAEHEVLADIAEPRAHRQIGEHIHRGGIELAITAGGVPFGTQSECHGVMCSPAIPPRRPSEYRARSRRGSRVTA